MRSSQLETILDAREIGTVTVPLSASAVDVRRLLRIERRLPTQMERARDCWAPNKPTLEFDGRATWAEYVLVRLLERAGWQARWVKNWTGGRQFCVDVGVPERLPDRAQAAFKRIDTRAASATGGGAWDIFAWKDSDFLILESKKYRSGDALRPGQIAWLGAALAEGFRPDQFVIVEYDPR